MSRALHVEFKWQKLNPTPTKEDCGPSSKGVVAEGSQETL